MVLNNDQKIEVKLTFDLPDIKYHERVRCPASHLFGNKKKLNEFLTKMVTVTSTFYLCSPESFVPSLH